MARRIISEEDLLPMPAQPAPAHQPVAAAAAWPAQQLAYPIPHPGQPVQAADHRARNRWLLGIVAFLLAIAIAAGGYFGGRATRPTDAAIAKDIAGHEQAVRDTERRSATSALAQQRREYRTAQNRAVARATREARAAGRTAGISQGVEQGRASGVQEGRAAGQAEGFDAGTCYTPTVPRYYVC